MPEVVLSGCTPEPLMGYLKALGVFRLVAEQADPDAQGCWRSGAFVINSTMDREALANFFLKDYQPTPIIGPWGARSGFYPGSSESAAREALNALVSAAVEQPRLQRVRDVVVGVRNILNRLGFAEKVRDEDKLTLMRACRNELPDAVLPWLDAVFILTDDSRKFPPLLGTGGNERSGSYVSTFAQVIVTLLIHHEVDDGVMAALYGDFGSVLRGLAVGHFNPGAIGGANSSQGFDGGGRVNLWDYLLALEGCLLFAGSAARRLGTDTAGRASYPFCVEAVAVGYASESEKEAGEGTRAELWLPTWPMPIALAELSQLLAEGRAQFGRHQARNSVEFALAACTLGVSRGIDAFIRYAFVMRNGLSYFAAPLGRVAVTPRPQARLLDDHPLVSWIERLRVACRDKEKTPSRYLSALRKIDRTIYEFATRAQTDASADRQALGRVLSAIGRAERTLANGLSFCEDNRLSPLQGLNDEWLVQTDDGSPEFGLAAAVAGIGGGKDVGPFRVHLEPVALNRAHRFEWDAGSTSAVWSNRPLTDNLASVFRRRQMEGFRAFLGDDKGKPRRPARLNDVIAYLNENTDDDKLEDLIWGLSTVEIPPNLIVEHLDEVSVPFEFGVLRLLVEPLALTADGDRWRIGGEGEKTKPDPELFYVLSTGGKDAVGECVDRAARRLKSAGFLVTGYRNRGQSGRSLAVTSLIPPTRLLAACLFPLAERDLKLIANGVLSPPETQE